MTDGRLYYGPRGEILKVFNVRDGLGIRAVADAGITVAVISGRRSTMVARRCRDLGIRNVVQGEVDKLPVLRKMLARLGIEAAHCACVGDDAVDVPLLEVAGLAFSVADAHASAKQAAHIVTKLGGGQGAVREICDYLIAARRHSSRARPAKTARQGSKP